VIEFQAKSTPLEINSIIMASIVNQASSSSPPPPPAPLKSKLNHIKDLLNDANHRLHQEAKIFTTKTSASSATKTNLNGRNNSRQQQPAEELRRTIEDISTIQSVLSCPIFNQIANVTDSLDRLSYHLNLRPSIGPTDIEFNDNGEIILAPPIEPTSLNNLINSRLDEYTNSTSQQNESNSFNSNVEIENGRIDQHQLNKHHHQQQIKQGYRNDSPTIKTQESKPTSMSARNEPLQEQSLSLDKNVPQQVSQSSTNQQNEYDTERLVFNGRETNYVNGNRQRRREPTKVQSVVAVFENADALASSDNENRRLYKANGHHALNQLPSDRKKSKDVTIPASDGQSMVTDDSLQSIGYTNDLYKAAHEINGSVLVNEVNHRSQVSQVSDLYANAQINRQHRANERQNDLTTTEKSSNAKVAQNNQGVSPSTSAGSTVRLADECDSGTSSFRSKGALYSPQSLKPIEQLDDDPVVSSSAHSSIDQELIEKLSPEMERIKVTLEKDADGLGITIAGYTCEQEEISGIFIKSITPGSPADRSGKIRILDQIFAVNGQEILAYSNPEAVNVLRRQTGRIVTLELMRYLAESKYKKLQTLLEQAPPSSKLQKSSAYKSTVPMDVDVQPTKAQPVMSSSSPKCPEPSQMTESVYNNTSYLMGQQSMDDNSNAASPIPVATQRLGATNSKVIETKQGARNKVDIRSPLCQATYANEIPPPEFDSSFKSNSTKSVTDRLRQEVSDEFSRLVGAKKLEWEKNVQIVELRRDSNTSLGFAMKQYANPKDPQQSIFMIVSITPGSITDLNGQLSVGDLLVFVDDTNLENATSSEAEKALRRANGQVRLGILKYKQQR
jgi:C-terminal processing protease CtpA/Prc